MRRILVGVLLLGACTSHATGPLADPVPATVTVSVDAHSCTVDRTKVPAGPVVFTVTSDGAAAGSEVELLDGARILGEEEAVQDGHAGGFALQLPAHRLQLLCLAGGHTQQHPLTVTVAPPRHLSAAAAHRQALLRSAAAAWQGWVLQQLDQLVTATKTFDDAVRSEDVVRAKALYAPARVFYERVEPVAESFGDLDPDIDARINDVVPPDVWTGFHRIEKALWADGSLAGMAPYATQLDVQVAELDRLARGISVTPGDLASGAKALLEEVATTKVTGEEERYSHLDLVDLQANVDGAFEAYTLLRPALLTRSTYLARMLDEKFVALQALLRSIGTPSYASVSTETRHRIADAVDAVAGAYASVPALLVV